MATAPLTIETRHALDLIELDICDDFAFHDLPVDAQDEFWAWAAENHGDWWDADGLAGKAMFGEWLTLRKQAARDYADERGDWLYHRSIDA